MAFLLFMSPIFVILSFPLKYFYRNISKEMLAFIIVKIFMKICNYKRDIGSQMLLASILYVPILHIQISATEVADKS